MDGMLRAGHTHKAADHGKGQKCAQLAFFGPDSAGQNRFLLIAPTRLPSPPPAPQLGGSFLMQMQTLDKTAQNLYLNH